MIISGIQKISLVDYPGKVACVIFTQGCNYRCPYCHNSPLLKCSKKSIIAEEEILNYIEKRKNILDAVVVSGGEATLQKDLPIFLQKLRKFKLKIKLDTNGSNPELLQKIITENLVDYIAMDIKNSLEKYSLTIGCKKVNIQNILESIKILKKSNIDYEFRTTIVKELHDINDIKKIKELIGSDSYYLQNFKDSENVLYSSLHGFSEKELIKIKKMFPGLEIRGLSSEQIKEVNKNVSC